MGIKLNNGWRACKKPKSLIEPERLAQHLRLNLLEFNYLAKSSPEPDSETPIATIRAISPEIYDWLEGKA